MKKTVNVLTALLATVMFILSSACTSKGNSAIASAQTDENIGTIAPINSQAVTSTPTPTSPITPEPTSTPTMVNYDEMIFMPTEEELSRIEKAAKQYREQLIDMYEGTSEKLDGSTDLSYILSSIRCLLGDFDAIYKWRFDPNNDSQIAQIEDICSDDMFALFNCHSIRFLDNYQDSIIEDTIFTPTYLNVSDYYKLADNYQIYTGLDLLVAEEYLFKDMCESLDDDWDVFSQKAIIYQSFVEDFYLNQDKNVSYSGDTLSSYQEAHPCVKMALLCNAYGQLKIIYVRALFEDKVFDGELRYSVVDLVNTILDDIINLDEELIPLMDAYMARVEAG